MIRPWLCGVMLAFAARFAQAQPGTSREVQVDVNARFDPGGLIDRLAVNAPMIERVAKGTFKRARRAVSIGPTVGVYGGVFPDAEKTDIAITFGLGVELFKIPILPSTELIKEIAIKRAKERLLAANPQPGDAEQLARQIWNDVVKEVLGMEDLRGRTMERPKLTLGLEVNRLLDSEVSAIRLRAGIGISRITVAASFSTAFTDPETSIYTGLELVGHFLMSKAPRASVVDVFVRGDFEVRNRDLANVDTYVLGVRYLLDTL